jgi:hypothetical protein
LIIIFKTFFCFVDIGELLKKTKESLNNDEQFTNIKKTKESLNSDDQQFHQYKQNKRKFKQ